jgi:methyl-accepting chemotaxis protein
MENLVKQDFAEQNNAANLLFQVYANSLRLGTLVTSNDPAESAALKSDVQEEQIKIDERFERLVEAAAKSKDASPVDEMVSAAGKLFNATSQLYKLHAEGDREADIAFFQKEMVPLRNVYLEKVKGAYDEQSRRIQKSEQEARAVSNKTRTQIIWMGVTAVAVGITAAALILKSLVPPIRKTMAVLGAVANGDLSQTLEIETRDELGAMAASLNTAVTAMKKSIEEVQLLRDREK